MNTVMTLSDLTSLETFIDTKNKVLISSFKDYAIRTATSRENKDTAGCAKIYILPEPPK